MPGRLVVAALLAFASLAAIAVATYLQNQELYFTVDELRERDVGLRSPLLADALFSPTGLEPRRPRVRVRGTVLASTVRPSADGKQVRFVLQGEAHRLNVLFRGLPPDGWLEAPAVTATGWLAADGTLAADQLIVQCPSKYEPRAPTTAAVVPAGRLAAPLDRRR